MSYQAVSQQPTVYYQTQQQQPTTTTSTTALLMLQQQQTVQAPHTTEVTHCMGFFDKRHIRLCWLEGMAAYFYVTIVAAARANLTTATEFTSFAAGAITMAVMFAFCGCTGNPAVLLAGVFSKKIPILGFVCGIVCQLAGGLVGAVTVYYGFSKATGDAVPVLVGGNSQVSGFVAELVGSFIFYMVYLVSHGYGHKGSRPIIVGFTIAAVGWAIAPISTSCLNPWYALSTSIVAGLWTVDTWIYYAGPFVASIVALIAAWIFSLHLRPQSMWTEYAIVVTRDKRN